VSGNVAPVLVGTESVNMPSLFIAIYVAIYPYTGQASQELSLVEGDVLYILEKSTEDDWWKAKKRMVGEEEDEPIGLVPNNYIEPVSLLQLACRISDDLILTIK
jgi:hypothetical protein